jgi:hypothetical protein
VSSGAVQQPVQQLGQILGCSGLFAEVPKSWVHLRKPVIHGPPRTSLLKLGVKWSQVQILSARLEFKQFRGHFVRELR